MWRPICGMNPLRSRTSSDSLSHPNWITAPAYVESGNVLTVTEIRTPKVLLPPPPEKVGVGRRCRRHEETIGEDDVE